MHIYLSPHPHTLDIWCHRHYVFQLSVCLCVCTCKCACVTGRRHFLTGLHLFSVKFYFCPCFICRLSYTAGISVCQLLLIIILSNNNIYHFCSCGYCTQSHLHFFLTVTYLMYLPIVVQGKSGSTALWYLRCDGWNVLSVLKDVTVVETSKKNSLIICFS